MKMHCLLVAALAVAVPQVTFAQSVEDAVTDSARSDADREMDAGRQPVEVLEFSAVERGDIVADFMAGGGYYTSLLADLVGPSGLVYAVNPTRFHNVEAWEARLAADSNIRTLVSDPRGMQLAPGSVDAIFAHLTFHDLFFESERFEFPRLDVDFMLANWFAAVRPGGTVTIIDHVGPAGDPRDVVNRLHRIHPATVVERMTGAGFVLVGQSDVLRRSNDDVNLSVFDESVRGKTDRFIMKFQKPE
ncbi:class I SAM-dependent methyltransferase [Parerythrobacter aestuarii]|uniref:class I SAM-dependent methyltransferase n=1 Tax=Parerythrobacter aestuarii TaxID=3020909 RepID=UPI0024DE3AFF|nr:methyltransferase domain-containing protein [Parerythrobacter aestuarii]